MLLQQRHTALQRFQEQEQNMQQRKNIPSQYGEYNYHVSSSENLPYYVQPMSGQNIMNPQPVIPGPMHQQSMYSQPMTPTPSQMMHPNSMNPQGMPFTSVPQQYMMMPPPNMFPQPGYSQLPSQQQQHQQPMYTDHQQQQQFYHENSQQQQ